MHTDGCGLATHNCPSILVEAIERPLLQNERKIFNSAEENSAKLPYRKEKGH
jgi:hypothetical protein